MLCQQHTSTLRKTKHLNRFFDEEQKWFASHSRVLWTKMAVDDTCSRWNFRLLCRTFVYSHRLTLNLNHNGMVLIKVNCHHNVLIWCNFNSSNIYKNKRKQVVKSKQQFWKFLFIDALRNSVCPFALALFSKQKWRHRLLPVGSARC